MFTKRKGESANKKLTYGQCIKLADMIKTGNRKEVISRLTRTPTNERAALAQQAKMLSRNKPECGILCLLRAIDEANKQALAEPESIKREPASEKAFLESRAASIALSKSHPKGKIIGATLITQYKAPGRKLRMVRRKRRR